MEQLTEQQASEMGNSKVWQSWTFEEKVKFQLFQDRLCMPFSVFHEAIEKIFKRQVFTHEFAYREQLILEYLGEKPTPTLQEIINLIPEEKRIVIFIQ